MIKKHRNGIGGDGTTMGYGDAKWSVFLGKLYARDRRWRPRFQSVGKRLSKGDQNMDGRDLEIVAHAIRSTSEQFLNYDFSPIEKEIGASTLGIFQFELAEALTISTIHTEAGCMDFWGTCQRFMAAIREETSSH